MKLNRKQRRALNSKAKTGFTGKWGSSRSMIRSAFQNRDYFAYDALISKTIARINSDNA